MRTKQFFLGTIFPKKKSKKKIRGKTKRNNQMKYLKEKSGDLFVIFFHNRHLQGVHKKDAIERAIYLKHNSLPFFFVMVDYFAVLYALRTVSA